MDRINHLFPAGLFLLIVMIITGCPQVQTLELRKIIEERVKETETVKLPKITVEQNDILIEKAGTKDIGSAVSQTTKEVVFTINNLGSAPLLLTGNPIVAITGTSQAEFSISVSPASPVAPGDSATFTLRFSPSSTGSKTVTLTVNNNTSDESSFSFFVTANATAAAAPLISISQYAIITKGGSIDIGSIVAMSTKEVVFTINNPGSAPLLLTGNPIVAITGTDQAEFSIPASPVTSIPASGSSTFTLRFSPSTAGTKTVTIKIINNTIQNSSFTFSVNASASAIVVDSQAPTGSLSIAGAASYSQSLNIQLTISATDLGGGSVTQMEVKNDNAFTGNWQSFATSLPWTLAGPDGTNTVYIRFKDNSGNISTPYNDTIILDRVSPSVLARPITNGNINVVRTTTLLYTFSEAISPATLNSATVKLDTLPGSGSVTVTINIPDNTHLLLTPVAPGFYFAGNYSLRLLSGITDLAGNPLVAETTTFGIENDIYENTGTGGSPPVNGKGNEYPNNPFWLFTSDPLAHLTSGHLFSQDYGGYCARTQLLGGLSDQDRYKLYIDCAQSNSITIHVFTTNAYGTPVVGLPAGKGVKFTLYNSGSSPVLISSSDLSLLKEDQLGTWDIPYGTPSGYYTLVVYGDDSGQYYDFDWSEDYNGM